MNAMLVCVLSAALSSGTWLPLLGQDSSAPRRSPWVAMVIALVLVICAIAVSVYSSRRSHQD